VLIPSAEDAREALSTGLRQHGAKVENIAVYRTVPLQTDLSGWRKTLLLGRIDAVTFTSSSTVRSFVDLVGRPAATSGRFVTATIGPVTADTARELGLREILEAEPHTVPGLVESLARRFRMKLGRAAARWRCGKRSGCGIASPHRGCARRSWSSRTRGDAEVGPAAPRARGKGFFTMESRMRCSTAVSTSRCTRSRIFPRACRLV